MRRSKDWVAGVKACNTVRSPCAVALMPAGAASPPAPSGIVNSSLFSAATRPRDIDSRSAAAQVLRMFAVQPALPEGQVGLELIMSVPGIGLLTGASLLQSFADPIDVRSLVFPVESRVRRDCGWEARPASRSGVAG